MYHACGSRVEGEGKRYVHKYVRTTTNSKVSKYVSSGDGRKRWMQIIFAPTGKSSAEQHVE